MDSLGIKHIREKGLTRRAENERQAGHDAREANTVRRQNCSAIVGQWSWSLTKGVVHCGRPFCASTSDGQAFQKVKR